MVFNGTPALACSSFINKLKKKEITIEPLSAFPTIQDLQVDRSVLFEKSKELELWLHEFQPPKEKEFKYQYNSAKWVKCGLCLEVCPNYSITNTSFYGPAVVHETYLTHSQNQDQEAQRRMKRNYQNHFSNHCSKSLSCATVCPLAMEPLSTIGLMDKI